MDAMATLNLTSRKKLLPDKCVEQSQGMMAFACVLNKISTFKVSAGPQPTPPSLNRGKCKSSCIRLSRFPDRRDVLTVVLPQFEIHSFSKRIVEG